MVVWTLIGFDTGLSYLVKGYHCYTTTCKYSFLTQFIRKFKSFSTLQKAFSLTQCTFGMYY